jgi:hypothetical protein
VWRRFLALVSWALAAVRERRWAEWMGEGVPFSLGVLWTVVMVAVVLIVV